TAITIMLLSGLPSTKTNLRGLRSGLIITLLLSYGNINSLAGDLNGIFPWLYLTISCLALWQLNRLKNISSKLNILLNTITTVIALSAVGHIIAASIQEMKLVADYGQPLTNQISLQKLNPAYNSPNIYHIILDEYAIKEALQEFAKYDNSSFLEQLEEIGFAIPSDSRSNYAHTTFSLPSLLNFSFLSDFEINSYNTFKTENIIHRILHNNNAFRSLRQAGYKIITTPVTIVQGQVRGADEAISDHSLNRFYLQILNNTPAKIWLKPQIYKTTVFSLETLPQLAKNQKQPFYVFSHICCPHMPFQLDENYQEVNYSAPYNQQTANEFKQHYQKQLTGLNKLVLKTVNEILANSDIKPIIIIQGDHGIRERLLLPGEKNSHLRSFGNLNALYLPGQKTDQISSSFSLVNTYRLIFNLYFGTQYPLLDDLCNNDRNITEIYQNALDELREKHNGIIPDADQTKIGF
ncbi:MAG: sulfatase-like hydrolase/transferase, partial [Sedimentisphaerales bacterium]|nr:sulfatase-like hydrolase/transferase [Sedimentisphaerales bacterium]